jgi:CO/xanthine dehydrogenase Mo-binding subunit
MIPEVKLYPAPIGTSTPRVDALEKVTGAAKFTDDLQFARVYRFIFAGPPHFCD